jgi:hypothetical protein
LKLRTTKLTSRVTEKNNPNIRLWITALRKMQAPDKRIFSSDNHQGVCGTVASEPGTHILEIHQSSPPFPVICARSSRSVCDRQLTHPYVVLRCIHEQWRSLHIFVNETGDIVRVRGKNPRDDTDPSTIGFVSFISNRNQMDRLEMLVPLCETICGWRLALVSSGAVVLLDCCPVGSIDINWWLTCDQ